MPGTDKDRHVPAAVNGAGLSPSIELKPDDCRFSRVGGDHRGAPGRSAAVQTEAGFDVIIPGAVFSLVLSFPSSMLRREKTGEN